MENQRLPIIKIVIEINPNVCASISEEPDFANEEIGRVLSEKVVVPQIWGNEGEYKIHSAFGNVIGTATVTLKEEE